MLSLVHPKPPTTSRAKAANVTLAQKPEPLVACLRGFDIPQFISRLAAGFPSPATDYMEEALDLNTFLVRHKAATFAFAVKGQSMRDAGIHDGDKVLVDRSVNPKHGQIVVAVVNGDYTIKRLHSVAGCIELHAKNQTVCRASFKKVSNLKFGV